MKRAEIEDNMDLSRIGQPTDKDHQQLRSCEKALALLYRTFYKLLLYSIRFPGHKGSLIMLP